MPFQSQVQANQAPGIAGDFCSANPRSSVLAGPGALIAGPAGLQPGLFAWIDPSGTVASNFGVGPVAGFVHREFGQAAITTFVAETGNFIQAGAEITLHSGGDFWVSNSGITPAVVGQKAYANTSSGAATFAATGTTVANSIETRWYSMSSANPNELTKMSSTAPG